MEVEQLLLNLLASGLWATISRVGAKGAVLLRERRTAAIFENSRDLRSRLGQAVDDLKTRRNGAALSEGELAFIASRECRNVVEQLFATGLARSPEATRDSIREEFVSALKLQDPDADEASARELFRLVLEATETGLLHAVDEGALAAHEALDAARYAVLFDLIGGIDRNVAFLSRRGVDWQRVEEFEDAYRRQVAVVHGSITPPHIDSARKFPIDRIYVTPTLHRVVRKRGREDELRLKDLVSMTTRAVILGNPGAGKSTLTHKLSFDLAALGPGADESDLGFVPFVVVLRDFGAAKRDEGLSVLEFIERSCNSKYQLRPPDGAVEYLLLNGRAMVIFDGLDELLDTTYRREVSTDVEAFANLYPSAPVVVTSREVGYDQAPLDTRRFDLFGLSPFDDRQVREYVEKWFAADPDLPPDERTRQVTAFLAESEVVPDLRSNPLMLALMCGIYRGENYIPRNRPDVYEKCATMLFDRWDRRRGLRVSLAVESHIDRIIMYLAHWIYGEVALQDGATEDALVRKAAEYLLAWRFEDEAEAMSAAREFVEFCRGRAWVLTDTGTTSEGEKLYQFTHRTFLEYFTAGYIVLTNPTAEAIAGALRARIARAEWDVVAQLAYQRSNRNAEGAGDWLLDDLLSQATQKGDDAGWNFLNFAARCLEGIIPRPALVRRLTLAVVDKAVTPQSGSPKPPTRRRDRSDQRPAATIGALMAAAPENREAVASVMTERLIWFINEGRVRDALVADALASSLPSCLHVSAGPAHPGRRPASAALERFAETISDQVMGETHGRIAQLSPKHDWAAFSAYRRGAAGIVDIAASRGRRILFWSPEAKFPPDGFYFSIAEHLVLQSLEREQPHPKVASTLEAAYEILTEEPPPYISIHEARRLGPLAFPTWGRGKTSGPNLSGSGLAAAVILSLVMLELFRDGVVATRELRGAKGWLTAEVIQPLLSLRMGKPVPNWSVASLDIPPEAKELLTAWSGGQITLVQGLGPALTSARRENAAAQARKLPD